MPTVPHPKNHIDSFRYAIDGIIHVIRTQRHMRFHFFTLVVAVLLGILYNLSSAKLAILFIVVSSVLVAEMFNTALESVVDMITQAYHPLAKLAKDIAAGAVLITAITAVVVSIILFLGDRQIALVHIAVHHNPRPLRILMAAAVLVLVIVLISKVIGGKGLLLSGGIVSGHSAIAFFLACTLIYRTADLVTAVLTLLLAFLVAQSRVEGKIHTLQEVIFGGLLGLLLTGGVYLIHFFP